MWLIGIEKKVCFFRHIFTSFDAFEVFSLGRLVLYTVFMVFPLPQTLVKTLAKHLVNFPDEISSNNPREPLLKGLNPPIT